MIIYTHNKHGKAKNFHGIGNSGPIPDGYFSIGDHPKTEVPFDQIPEDTSVFDLPGYENYKHLQDQESELLRLISDNEYHLISRRFAKDLPAWESKLDEWAAQLEEVKAGKLVDIAEKPFL